MANNCRKLFSLSKQEKAGPEKPTKFYFARLPQKKRPCVRTSGTNNKRDSFQQRNILALIYHHNE